MAHTTVYTDDGREIRVPEHYLDIPALSKGLHKTKPKPAEKPAPKTKEA